MSAAKYISPDPLPKADRDPVVLASLEAEALVLCACSLDTDRLDECMAILRVQHFYSDANGLIWQALVELRQTKQNHGLADVFQYLRATDNLGRVGGAPYLETVLRFQPYSVAALDHARIVRSMYQARETVLALDEARTRITMDGPEVVMDVLRQLGERTKRARL